MTAVVIRALEAYLGLRWPFRVGGVDLPRVAAVVSIVAWRRSGLWHRGVKVPAKLENLPGVA